MRASSGFCNSSGSERFSTTKVSSIRPSAANTGFKLSDLGLVRGHVEERDGALRKRVGHGGDDGIAQLAFDVAHQVGVARSADLGVKDARIEYVPRINPIAAQ